MAFGETAFPCDRWIKDFKNRLCTEGGGIGQPADPPGGEGKYTDPILFRNGVAEQQKGYCTDVYYSNAMEFIEKSAKQQKPFFVYLPDNCPHGPFHDVPADDLATYRQVDLENSAFPQDEGHKLPAKSDVDKRARIFAMITNVDRNVGRLQKKLDALGITDNTIVIFMVDNGPNGRRYVAGFNGNKSTVWEGGIRSPFFVQWPARLKAGHASDIPSAHIDVLPTLLEAAGIERPDDIKLDGRSMLPYLEGRPINTRERHLVIQSHRGDQPVAYHNFMIRNGRWKLLHASGFGRESFEGQPKFQLFDLTADPYELNDLAAENPDVVRQMRREYDRWFADVSSTRPDNYAPPRIYVGTKFENPVVLTRQDWRHTKGRPWAADSIGHWLLKATQSEYDVRCRFAPIRVAGKASLRIDEDVITVDLLPNASTCEFTKVEIPEGNVRLSVELIRDGKLRGAHQVDVERIE